VSKVKHEAGEFQFELPKEILDDIPFLFRGPAKDFVKFLNDLDLTKDGKSDVAQLAPFVIKALPFLIELAKLIDWEKFLAWVVQQFAKDKKGAAVQIAELKAVGGEVVDILPPEAKA